MKKVIGLILVFVMSFTALVGCGNGGDDNVVDAEYKEV